MTEIAVMFREDFRPAILYKTIVQAGYAVQICRNDT